MATLSSMFAIDVCAYAIMSNHYHLVLKADAVRARTWSADEVIDRWKILFAGPDLIKRYRTSTCLSPAEHVKVLEIIDTWRERLCDISWYMRVLNEHIARLANAEDACTGRFWEGRFRSQALLDEQAVLTCMAYVDLNPIRARIAQCPQQSDFTSIQQRISAIPDEARQPTPSVSRPPRHPLVTVIGDIAEVAIRTDDIIGRPACPLLDFMAGKTRRPAFLSDSTTIWNSWIGVAGRYAPTRLVPSLLACHRSSFGWALMRPRFLTMLCRCK